MQNRHLPADPVFAAIYRQHLRRTVINNYGHDLYLCLKHLWNLGFRGAELRFSSRLPSKLSGDAPSFVIIDEVTDWDETGFAVPAIRQRARKLNQYFAQPSVADDSE